MNCKYCVNHRKDPLVPTNVPLTLDIEEDHISTRVTIRMYGYEVGSADFYKGKLTCIPSCRPTGIYYSRTHDNCHYMIKDTNHILGFRGIISDTYCTRKIAYYDMLKTKLPELAEFCGVPYMADDRQDISRVAYDMALPKITSMIHKLGQ